MKILKCLLLIILVLCVKPINAQTIINMTEDNGVLKIPGVVNGLRLKFIFDTGASNVCMSEQQAIMMLENDYLSIEDIKGGSKSILADGSIIDNTHIRLKELVIGGKTLRNIEAVVLHSQNAPLLLGLNAIQKLGYVTLSGKQLIINDCSDRNRLRDNLSEEECEQILKEANLLYDNDAYAEAKDKYQQLYNVDYLSAYGVSLLARSCLLSSDYNLALKYYFEIEDEYKKTMSNTDISYMYKFISSCYNHLNQFDENIRFLKIAITYADDDFYRFKLRDMLAWSYTNISEYESKSQYENLISDYCKYMDINPKDCWTKGYKDKFLSELYWSLRLCNKDYDNNIDKKYNIISAAWGNEKAVERCKELDINYFEKPYNYEY